MNEIDSLIPFQQKTENRKQNYIQFMETVFGPLIFNIFLTEPFYFLDGVLSS